MDLRIGRQDEEGPSWTVLSDLAITMVLVLILLVLLQFLVTFWERAVNQELTRRQHEVRDSLASYASEGAVRIDSIAPDRQRLTFSSAALFPTCDARLEREGRELLGAIGALLGRRAQYFEAIHIEGHTDTVPTNLGCDFPSNWELSSARATSVVRVFVDSSAIDARKLSAIGRAEFHPVRRERLDLNRRIEVILQFDREQVVQQMQDRASSTPNN